MRALPLIIGLAAIAGSAHAQARFAATCPVVSQGFQENGAPIPAPAADEDSPFYALAAFPDGVAATYLGEMTFFVNCTSTGDTLRCAETRDMAGLRKVDSNVTQSIEVDRKTGAFHAVVQLKSKPSVRRDSRGTCTFEE